MNRKDVVYRIFCIVLLVFAMVSVVQGCRNAVAYPAGSFDFQWDSAKFLSMGINPYQETLNPTGKQEEMGFDIYYSSLEANQFPSMLMILLPYTIFTPMLANLLWLLSNLLFSAGIIVLIKNLFFDNAFFGIKESVSIWQNESSLWAYIPFIALFFIGLPWRNNIGNGQHTIMAFFFFLWSLYLCEKKSNKWYYIFAGILLAISFFKYTLTVPLAIYYFYKKEYKILGISVGIHILLTVAAAWWLRAPVWEMIIVPLKIASGMASAGAYDIGSVFGLGRVGMVLTIFILLAVFVYFLFGNFKGTDGEMISLLLMLSLIIVYHMIYDYFVLIVPWIVFLLKKGASKLLMIGKTMLTGCVFFVFVIEKIISAVFGRVVFLEVAFALFYYLTIVALFVCTNSED